MKVLQIIDSLEAGGAERMAVNIANVLAKAGHESHLCVTRKEGLLKGAVFDKVGYLFLEKKGKIGWKSIFELCNFIKKHQIEVVHAHSTSVFIAVAALCFSRNKFRLIWHDHYGKANQLEDRPLGLLKMLSTFFNHIISVNRLLKHWAIEELKCKQVTYLGNFAVKGELEQLAIPLKGVTGKRIVCLANLREQKDHFNLIEAFSLIAPENTEWTLHLCGQDFNDIYSSTLKEAIHKKNLSQNIFILGSRGDVSAILDTCDLGILSSKSEGLPVALLEYGLHKLPVIATDVGACAEVIKEYGIVVPPQDAVVLSQSINQLINDPEKRNFLAYNFNQHIVENYGSERYVKRLLEIYSK